MAEQQGSSPMFAIFVLTLLSLALFPYTIYRFCNAGDAEERVVKPWQTKGKGKNSVISNAQGWLTCSNVTLVALWILWGLILLYTQQSASDTKPFDPYDILNLQPGASSADIKRQYRKLALEYHPDKNPDPAASKYFAEYVTKAHTALTDETAKKNYEKYGHPDGPQPLDIGIALPEWIFSKDRNTAPLVLAGLVLFGILLPLGVASWYLLRSNKFTGPNHVMHETMNIYFRSQLGVKESQGLSRIPDTLVVAMEFITMPTPNEQGRALEELRKTVLRIHPELKDKSLFWNRKTAVKKVHMLLLAYLSRREIPDSLENDLQFVLKKSPIFLEEIVKIAQIPRHPQQMWGWYEPTKAAIQMCQCIVQAVSTDIRKGGGAKTKGPSESAIPLLQLPHFDQDLLRRLGRKQVRALPDLFLMQPEDRRDVYAFAGLSSSQAEEVETSLMAMPTVHMAAHCVVDGEESSEIMESDIVTCAARVVLTRHSHLTPGFQPESIKGSGVQAYAPNYRGVKMEKWSLILCDPNQNQVWGVVPISLVEAERNGATLVQRLAEMETCSTSDKHDAVTDFTDSNKKKADGHKEEEASPSLLLSNPKTSALIAKMLEGQLQASGSSAAVVKSTPNGGPSVAKDAEVEGQLVEVKFPAKKAGRYNLQLMCMSDSWIGSDVSIPVTVRIIEMSKADKEGRTYRGKALPLDNEAAQSAGEADEEDEEDEENGEYDSEESGTEESGNEDDADDEDADSESSQAG